MRKRVFLLLIVFAVCCPVFGKQPQLPVDSSVRTGRLANGMTYYVRATPFPAGRACFYLVQRVGALIENDSQNGLAHFLEHMAFNGTRHFPGKTMVGKLERHGLTYGKDITAYTALNETVYGLNNVPVEKALTDSCLLVLYDWAHGLTLDSAAVSAERSVILEEWRTRRDALFRLNAKTVPVVYKGSRYAVRDIIGDTAIISTVRPEDLRSFYQTWYRPDLQAVVVTGDFDADGMVQDIKSLFSAIPGTVHVPERPFFEIPLDGKLSFVQATDPEIAQERIEIRTIQAGAEPGDLRASLVTELFNRLMRERMSVSFRENKIPAMGGALIRLSEQPGYNTLLLIVLPRPGYEEKVVEAALAEKERVKRFGFTQGEIGRTRSVLMREAETAFEEYGKQPSPVWVEKLSRHFLDGLPLTGPQAYLEFVRRELPAVTPEELTACLRQWDDGSHCAVSVTGPAGMKPMDAGMFERMLEKVASQELTPFEDKAEEYVLEVVPSGSGKIVKERELKQLQAEEWILSNGARVIFRPAGNENQLSLMAYCPGGLDCCPAEDIPAASLLPVLIDNYGAGTLNAVQLDKALSGRNISCGVALKPWYSGIGGQAPAKEAETLLQLVWARLEQPRFDSVIHKGLVNRYKKQLADRRNDPYRRISDTLNAVLGNYAPRSRGITPQQLDQVTIDQVKRIYQERFGNISGFTFILVGNVDAEVLKPLVEKYIGSVPRAQGKKVPMDKQSRRPEKVVMKEISLPLSSARSTVIINYAGKMGYTFERELYQMIVKELLEVRCMQQLRMKEGATYQVMVQGTFEAMPAGKCSLMFNFDCAPERAKGLAEQVTAIVRELAGQGPSEDELARAIKKVQTGYELARQTNSFWTNALFFWSLNGIDRSDERYYRQWMEKIKPADIRHYTEKMLGISELTGLVFKPEGL